MTGPDSNAHHDGAPRHGTADQWDGEASEASFRQLVERSPDGIVVHREGRIVYANATAMRWVGAQFADQVRGHPLTTFIHPDSIEPVLARMAALRAAGDVSRASEGVLVRLDGTTLNVEAVTALTTWEGTPAYHVTLRDLTFVRTTQRSLRYQAALVDRVGVAVIATTVTGLVTKWNRAAEAIYHRPAASALALPIAAAVGAPLDPATIVAGGGVVHATHHTSDGYPLIIRVSATALDTGYAMVCTDETRSHGMERLLRRIVNSLDEGILVIDGAGSVTSANPAAEKILGLPAAVLTGGDGRAIHAVPMFDSDRRRIDLRDHPVTHTLRTGQASQGFVVGIDRSDGRRTWLRGSCRPLDSDDRYGAAILVSFSDITAERVARERLTYRATHDALTGLPNRAAVLAHISNSLRAQGDQRLGAVLFIDLDNLKSINDSLGHDSGDEILRSVAQCLRASVGPNDMVGRFGGDEFIALVAGVVEQSDVVGFVGRLERSLSEPMKLGAATVRTQASIGVTVVAPDDPRSAIEILRDADSAMYETKAMRRRRIHREPGPPERRIPHGEKDTHHGTSHRRERHSSRAGEGNTR